MTDPFVYDTNTSQVLRRSRPDRIGRPTGGFTLVEILIVIVILGVLATVVVFAVRGTTSRASANVCANERKSIDTAYEAYLVQQQVASVPATGVGPDRYERSMTAVGILREVSSNWEVDANGIIAAQAGGACV